MRARWNRLLERTTELATDFLGLVLVALCLAAIGGAVLGVQACQAHIAYGDWTCAIKHCVEVKP